MTKNKKYCSNPRCSYLLAQTDILRDVGTCPKCQHQTCLICNEKRHADRDCPNDEAVREVMSMAAELNWRQCPTGHVMVEHAGGCNRIT
jgi:hypothetical protein